MTSSPGKEGTASHNELPQPITTAEEAMAAVAPAAVDESLLAPELAPPPSTTQHLQPNSPFTSVETSVNALGTSHGYNIQYDTNNDTDVKASQQSTNEPIQGDTLTDDPGAPAPQGQTFLPPIATANDAIIPFPNEQTLLPSAPLPLQNDFDLDQQHLAYAHPALSLFPQNHLDAVSDAMMNFLSMTRDPIPPRTTIKPEEVDLNYYDDTCEPNFPSTYPGDLPDAGLRSFARIEFADSVFQMTTYSVIIGRDQRALEQARRDERRQAEYERVVADAQARGFTPPPPPSQNVRKFSKSYVSEEGGMLGPESDGEGPRPAKRRKTRSGSGSQGVGGGYVAVEAQPQEKNHLMKERQYVSHTPGAATVDLAALRAPVDYVPFIGIHSPGPDIAQKTKAISREHLRIEFNKKDHVFEAIPLHKNGFFHNEVHYSDERLILKSGDVIQIKDVRFTFINHGVDFVMPDLDSASEVGEGSSKKHSASGKEMSFEFESSHAGEVRETSEEDDVVAMDVDGSEIEGSDIEDEDAEEDDEDDDEDEQDVRETVESDEDQVSGQLKSESGLPTMPPKKRGPGRPPKNGIMSKREERLMKKAALEEAKKHLPAAPPGEPPIKRKVGRPRKNPLPEDGEKAEKRKYKPRKPKNPDDPGSDNDKVIKEKKREKPKTPPLELKADDFTPEQLEKPNKNYGVLIDEVLSDAPQGLTLKQIYKRIQQKYPFYYFTVETKGWESSVRHNLIGNSAFKKVDETHLWFRVEGVELDAGKKRKATSPERSQSAQRGMGYSQMPPGHYQPGMVHGAQAYAPQHVGAVQYPNPATGQAYNGIPGAHQAYNPAMPVAATPSQGGGIGPGAPQQVYPNTTQGQGHGPSPGIATAQAPAYNPAAPPHQMQQGAQSVGYNSPYIQRPVAQPGMPTNANQPSAPAQGSYQVPPTMQRAPTAGAPQHSMAPVAQTHTAIAGPAGTPAATSSVPNGAAQPSAVLKPAIASDRVQWIQMFKKNVIDQIKQRLPKGEAVAMSVINRGLGLSAQCTVPEQETVEKIIYGVFVHSMQLKYGPVPPNSGSTPVAPNSASTPAAGAAPAGPPGSAQLPAATPRPDRPNPTVLDPRLVAKLVNFKKPWIEVLAPKVGAVKADALLMSAIDRVLGLTEGSIMFPENEAERKEYEAAENLFIPEVDKQVQDFRRMITYEPAAAS